jgi:hypothetical protein
MSPVQHSRRQRRRWNFTFNVRGNVAKYDLGFFSDLAQDRRLVKLTSMNMFNFEFIEYSFRLFGRIHVGLPARYVKSLPELRHDSGMPLIVLKFYRSHVPVVIK